MSLEVFLLARIKYEKQLFLSKIPAYRRPLFLSKCADNNINTIKFQKCTVAVDSAKVNVYSKNSFTKIYLPNPVKPGLFYKPLRHSLINL